MVCSIRMNLKMPSKTQGVPSGGTGEASRLSWLFRRSGKTKVPQGSGIELPQATEAYSQAASQGTLVQLQPMITQKETKIKGKTEIDKIT